MVATLLLNSCVAPGKGYFLSALPYAPALNHSPQAGWDTASFAETALSTTEVHPGNSALTLEFRYPLRFETYHVQGLTASSEYYYVSSVDRNAGEAWLFSIDRATMELRSSTNLTENRFIHPGGISMGSHLWIPNAEYDRDGPSVIVGVDPKSLEERVRFSVNDHISLVVEGDEGTLYGTNWDSRHFYVWDATGKFIDRVQNPTGAAYQDCYYQAPYLVCGGYVPFGFSAMIDVIDPVTWSHIDRIPVGRTSSGSYLTREGLYLESGRLYVLPEDGPNSEILVFRINN